MPSVRLPRPRLAVVILVEAVLLAAVACGALGASPWVMAPAGVLGAVLTAAHVRGRWGLEWVAVWWRYRLRARRSESHRPPSPVTVHVDRSGATLGVLAEGTALGVMIEITPTAWPPPLKLVGDMVEYHGIRLDGVQFLERFSAAGRRVTLTLRLNPSRCPAAVTARGGGADGARRALSAVASELNRRLAETGVRGQVLDPANLADAVTDPVGEGRLIEGWDHCTIGVARHELYEAIGWAGESPALVNALARLPAAEVAVAFVVTPGEWRPRVRTFVRVVLPAAGDAPSAAPAVALRAGARLRRLDGEQIATLGHTVPGLHW